MCEKLKDQIIEHTRTVCKVNGANKKCRVASGLEPVTFAWVSCGSEAMLKRSYDIFKNTLFVMTLYYKYYVLFLYFVSNLPDLYTFFVDDNVYEFRTIIGRQSLNYNNLSSDRDETRVYLVIIWGLRA